MKKIIHTIILALSCFVLIFAGCSKEDNNKEQVVVQKDTLSAAGNGNKDKNFKVQYSSPRNVFKIEEVDLDNNGRDEYLVFSIANDTLNKSIHQFYKFDMMEVFFKDTVNNSYQKISTDTVDFSDEYWIMNLEKDKTKQIIIKTNMGGNDAVNSRGMYIFNYADKKINLIKYFDTGNPEVKDINGDDNKEILVSDSFFGILPESNNIYYTSEIYKCQNGNLINANKDFKNYFSEKASTALFDYKKIKERIIRGEKIKTSEYPLYKQAVDLILNYKGAGELGKISSFWNLEKDFLEKNLQSDEFLDLKTFISKLPLASSI